MTSLRRQLTLGMLGAFTLLLGAGGGAVYFALKDSLYDQFDAGLRVKALIVITDTQYAGGRIRVYFSDRFLREFDDALATEFFQVFDVEGRPVEHSDSLPADAVLPVRVGTRTAPEFWNMTLPNGEPGRAVGIRFNPPIPHARRGQTTAVVEPVEAIVVVAASRRAVDETVGRLRGVLVGVGATLLALTGVIVPWGLRRGLRPLERMAGAAVTIDADTLARRFAVDGIPRELEPIAERLNDLLSRLQASFERERRFSADIAHELRTPLAELRTMAEVALKWPEERAPGTDQAVLEIAVQMERLVARLLALGRAEQGRAAVQHEEVAVAPFLRGLVALSAGQAKERRIAVELAIPEEAQWLSDPELLRSIAGNLVENAVQYATEGSVVRVVWREEEDGAGIDVANTAPGLETDDVERMFERFWRKDPARSSGTHSGLGLALSLSLVRLLGGTLKATLIGSELVMALRLPRRAA